MKQPVLPGQVIDLVTELSACRGVRAVTLGGSRAVGSDDEHSDWDIGVYYDDDVDLSPVSRRGELHPPGSWGRFMNGGAWLEVDGIQVDVVLRDAFTVETWAARARDGDFEVDHLLGHLAGYPSYTLVAEVALSQVLFGNAVTDTDYPGTLSAVAARRWSFHRDFSLEYAMMHARRGDLAATAGTLVRAGLEEAHRRAAATRRWAVNEKRLMSSTGVSLDAVIAGNDDPVALVEAATLAITTGG